MSIAASREFSNSILFEFDTLIDLHIGVVKALQNEFLHSGGFNPNINYSFLSIETEDSLKSHRLLDLDYDIIQESFLGEARESYKEIYLDFIDKEYDKIIELSPKTEISRLIHAYDRAGFIQSFILCKNQTEVNWTREIVGNKARTLLIDSEKKIKLSSYARLCLSNIFDITRFKNVESIHIMILNYAENFTLTKKNDRILRPEMIVLLGDVNEFEIIDPYPSPEIFG